MTARHRTPGLPLLRSHPLDFRPRHCGGTSCFHDHDGGSPLTGHAATIPPSLAGAPEETR